MVTSSCARCRRIRRVSSLLKSSPRAIQTVSQTPSHSHSVTIAGSTKADVADSLVSDTSHTVNNLIQQGLPRVSIGIAGGSLPSLLQSLPDTLPDDIIPKLDFLFVDERCVPIETSESNVNEARNNFLTKLEAQGARVAVIDHESAALVAFPCAALSWSITATRAP